MYLVLVVLTGSGDLGRDSPVPLSASSTSSRGSSLVLPSVMMLSVMMLLSVMLLSVMLLSVMPMSVMLLTMMFSTSTSASLLTDLLILCVGRDNQRGKLYGVNTNRVISIIRLGFILVIYGYGYII